MNRKLFLSILMLVTFFNNGCSLLIGNIKPVDEKSEDYIIMDLSKYDPDWIRLNSTTLDEQTKNNKMETFRSIPAKTIEEQKQFLDLKFPKKGKKKKFKITWKGTFIFFYTMIIYMIFFKLWEKLFIYFQINLQLWQVIIFAIIFPLILNMILNKFNIQKGDVAIFFRKSKTKTGK